jgi:uncharacterized membrane protein YeaQ/YmgE (transglycosylase-associated protein family)
VDVNGIIGSVGGFGGIVGWVVFGLIVGIIAKFLLPGKDPGGFFVTILIGIAGAVLGGYIGQAMGWYAAGETAGFLMSIGGALILLIVNRMLFGQSKKKA